MANPIAGSNATNPFNGLVNQTPLTPILNTQPSQPQQPQCNIIWVDSMDDVLNHPTSSSTHLYFAERNNPILWVRETDANGKIKNPLKRLSYNVEDVPFGPEANFVTKDEHQKLYSLVEDMNKKLEKLLNG